MQRNLGVLAVMLLGVVVLHRPNPANSAVPVGQSLTEWAEVFTREWALRSPKLALRALAQPAPEAAVASTPQLASATVKASKPIAKRVARPRQVTAVAAPHYRRVTLDTDTVTTGATWTVYAERIVQESGTDFGRGPTVSITRFHMVIWRTTTMPRPQVHPSIWTAIQKERPSA
jgi:hypothetical protein